MMLSSILLKIVLDNPLSTVHDCDIIVLILTEYMCVLESYNAYSS